MSSISPAELARVLEQNPEAVLIDVRTPVEFEEVHHPKARNLPLGQLNLGQRLAQGELPADQPIYLFCRSGGRAAKAQDEFRILGNDHSVVVTGGMLAWDAANLPVVRGQVKVIGLERQVRIAAGSLVLLGVILSLVLNPWFILLSGFVGAGLVFAGITDWCGMGLLLAKAPWNNRAPRSCATGNPSASPSH